MKKLTAITKKDYCDTYWMRWFHQQCFEYGMSIWFPGETFDQAHDRVGDTSQTMFLIERVLDHVTLNDALVSLISQIIGIEKVSQYSYINGQDNGTNYVKKVFSKISKELKPKNRKQKKALKMIHRKMSIVVVKSVDKLEVNYSLLPPINNLIYGAYK